MNRESTQGHINGPGGEDCGCARCEAVTNGMLQRSPRSSVNDVIASLVSARTEATEAMLADVVCATPIEHLWRLAIVESSERRGLIDFGPPVTFEFELPTVCSRIPDIIGGIVYNSTPPAEMLAIRQAELERRAANRPFESWQVLGVYR